LSKRPQLLPDFWERDLGGEGQRVVDCQTHVEILAGLVVNVMRPRCLARRRSEDD
jgi:hypothetical protein